MKRRHFDLLDHEDEEPHTSGMNGSISENFSTHTGKKKPREKGPMGSRVSPNPRKTERGPVPSLILPDHERRSAFAPYRPSTVLTNLSRGNIQQEVVPEAPAEFCIYQLAGQGELTPDQIAGLDNVDVPDENGSTLLMWASRHGQVRTSIEWRAKARLSPLLAFTPETITARPTPTWLPQGRMLLPQQGDPIVPR
ncbi:unnamed protein product [Cyprideis torosa]|uniref:Uncharacterized protein n=1 Tax=Cyprideis torosa TaxID=163714 RepID=A0A7R8ZRP8_9CRUS|nr:unnamed protein product [Cyprideis torosa]CAG0893703.1 unnamed protein product [Cyprideis torosa]